MKNTLGLCKDYCKKLDQNQETWKPIAKKDKLLKEKYDIDIWTKKMEVEIN